MTRPLSTEIDEVSWIEHVTPATSRPSSSPWSIVSDPPLIARNVGAAPLRDSAIEETSTATPSTVNVPDPSEVMSTVSPFE